MLAVIDRLDRLVCAPLDSLIPMAAGEFHAGSSHAQWLGAPR